MPSRIRTSHFLILLTILFCRSWTQFPECRDLHNENELMIINGTQVRIKLLTVNEDEDLHLQFETNLQTHYNILVYIDYPILNFGPRTVCNKSCPDNGTICHCESKSQNPELVALHYKPVSVILNLTLHYGVLQFVWRIHFLEYIVPGCVQDIQLINKTTNSATIMFSLSRNLNGLIGFMDSCCRPLRFLVGLHKTIGIDEYLQLTLEATVKLNNAILNFEHLSPNVNYTFSITSYAGDTIGCNKSISFTTSESMPIQSPELTSFDYSWSFNEHIIYSLWMIWQPLSYETMGSDEVKYEVCIFNSSSLIHHFNTSSNFFNVTLGDITETLSVRVWAFNHLGKSKQYSEIHIPFNKETNDASTVIEFINKTHMYISMNISWEVQQVAVRFIKNKTRFDQAICSECVWTQRKVFNVTRQDDDATQNKEKHLVTFVFSFIQSETKLLQREVTYQICNDYETCKSNALSNLTANVTQIFQESQNNFIGVSEIGHREVKQPIKTSSCLIFGQSTIDAVYPKIFISFKQNDVFQRMTEAKCYYSRIMTSAKVMACYQDGCLQVYQDNDCSQAQQFLINSFEIIPSVNGETCNATNKYMLNYTREIMLLQKCDLPSHWKFVCIRANGNTTSIISEPMSLEVSLTNLSQSSTTNFAIFISVGCIVSLCLVLLILRCMCLCKKRKHKITQLFTFGNERLYTLQLPTTSNNDEKNESYSTTSEYINTHLDDNSSGTTLVTYMMSNSSDGNSYTRIGCLETRNNTDCEKMSNNVNSLNSRIITSDNSKSESSSPSYKLVSLQANNISCEHIPSETTTDKSYDPLQSSDKSYDPLQSSDKSYDPLQSSDKSYDPLQSSDKSYDPLQSSANTFVFNDHSGNDKLNSSFEQNKELENLGLHFHKCI